MYRNFPATSGSRSKTTSAVSPSAGRGTVRVSRVSPGPASGPAPAGVRERVTVAGRPANPSAARNARTSNGSCRSRSGENRTSVGAETSATRTSVGGSVPPTPTARTGTFSRFARPTAASTPAPAFCPPSLSTTTPASVGPRTCRTASATDSPSRVSGPSASSAAVGSATAAPGAGPVVPAGSSPPFGSSATSSAEESKWNSCTAWSRRRAASSGETASVRRTASSRVSVSASPMSPAGKVIDRLVSTSTATRLGRDGGGLRPLPRVQRDDRQTDQHADSQRQQERTRRPRQEPGVADVQPDRPR